MTTLPKQFHQLGAHLFDIQRSKTPNLEFAADNYSLCQMYLKYLDPENHQCKANHYYLHKVTKQRHLIG